MNKKLSAIAALSGAIAVALGALGAHALKQKVEAGIMTVSQLEAFDTATKYQLFHAVLLIALSFYSETEVWIKRAAILFLTGILFFSGSIYFLSTKSIMGIENLKWLGPVTPIGGLLLISGWILLFYHFIRKK